MRMAVVAMIALMAAACGRSEEAARNQGVDEAGVESAGNRLAAMPEGQRNAVFIRAIRDARLDCQHVESSSAAGEYRGMPVWNVRCSGGGDWTVVIGGDGVAQILSPDEARLVGQTLPAQADK